MTQAHPRISVSGICALDWTIEQDIAFLEGQGVGAIGLLGRKIRDDVDGFVAAVSDSSLTSTLLVATPANNALIGTADGDETRALDSFKPYIDAAARLGCGCYFTTGPAPHRMPTDIAYDRLVEAIGPIKAYADQQGVPLALEHSNAALRDNGFVNTLRDAFDFAQETGLGVDLEIQNCWIERRLPELFRQNVERIALVQVSDFKVGESPRMNRRVLGDGDIPLEWLLGQLLEAGYKGYFEIETLGPAIEAEGYASAMLRSIAWLDARLNAWGV